MAAVEISIISFDLDTLFQLEQMMFHCVLLRPFLNDSTAARVLAEHLPLSELSDPHIILLRLMSAKISRSIELQCLYFGKLSFFALI